MKRLFVSVFILLSVSVFFKNILWSQPRLAPVESFRPKDFSAQQLSVIATKPKDELTADEVIYRKDLVWDAFQKIAFGSEFVSDKKKDHKWINKWKIPVVFHVQGLHKEKYEWVVEQHAERLNAVIDHPIKKVDPNSPRSSKVTAIIVLTDDIDRAILKDYRNAIAKAHGELNGWGKDLFNSFIQKSQKASYQSVYIKAHASMIGNSNIGEQIRAFVFVDVIPSYNTQEALIEEMTQILGLFSDARDLQYTMFNDRQNQRDWTSLDILLLKILYHPEVEMGMSLSEMQVVFNQIYEQIMQDWKIYE